MVNLVNIHLENVVVMIQNLMKLLHETYSQWNMYNLQTTTEIYKTYGITSDDLPTGRHI